MISISIFLFCLLGIGGAVCILVSLFSFVTGAIEKDPKRVSFGGKMLLLGIGILIVWIMILMYTLRGWHC